MSAVTCRAPGCDELLLARGFCQLHYHRWWRRNRATLVDARYRPDRPCAVEGCPRSALGGARGWCRKHYACWQRTGDPLGSTAIPDGTRRLDRDGYVFVKVPPDHPLARRSRFVGEHRIVLYEAIGPGPHGCNWCGQPLEWGRNLVADHVDGHRLNNSATNLVPACARCNLARRTACVCRACGASLEGRRDDARYCSAACRRRAGRDLPPPRHCRECGELISGRRADAWWCSERCRSRFRRCSRAEPGLDPSNGTLTPNNVRWLARHEPSREPVELGAAA